MSGSFNLVVDGIEDHQPIPDRFAKGAPDGKGKIKDSDNIRPAMKWETPKGAKSFAILVVDRDVPKDFSDANQEGRTIPSDAPRKNFYHWVQVNIPVDCTSLPEGKAGKVTPGTGGVNSYGKDGTDKGMGYDGPCPPFNDERLHNYYFIVYALSVEKIDLSGAFSGEEAEKAIKEHSLGEGEITGTYSTYKPKKKAA